MTDPNKDTKQNIYSLLDTKGFFKSYILSWKNSFTNLQIRIMFFSFFIMMAIISIPFSLYISNIRYIYIFKIFYYVISNCLKISIAFFAVIFTGYSIFQALLSNKFTFFLVRNSFNEDISYYQVYGEFFFVFLINMLFFIIISSIFMFILYIFRDVSIYSLNKELKLIYSLSMGGYLSVFLLLIYNIKSLIFNIFRIYKDIGAENAISSLKREYRK